jgi:phosphoglycolate phosphatase
VNLLFDLDGTLTDSRIGIERCICHALAEMGVVISDQIDLTKYLGPPLRDSFSELLNTQSVDDIEHAVRLYRERFGEVGLYENSVYEGIEELLQDLVGVADKLFVSTSKPRIYAEEILRHFNLAGFFAGIYGSEMDGRLSAKSELIGHVLRLESLDPNHTVMVGDREYDVIGAKQNALESIGVLWGFGDRQELVQSGASWLCSKPMEIAAIARG